ncbi:AAA family ATPase [Gemmata sp. G18]|uniref:AAA family ATPase n=1 Tax=Gemmata palustris TaxID=2822762 RepID=A0ABS5BY96_9BACT|nr:MoxR family ATPase [Gemmata palustris]MBP3958701.1 AAA family ATPase [Gemmata palustris]
MPPWRDFSESLPAFDSQYHCDDKVAEVVNAAILLRRPLLVTGRPGSGKSSLARAIADDLRLGEVLTWPINSRSTLTEGLYTYDAIARLRDAQLPLKKGEAHKPIGEYIRLNALGTALYGHPKKAAGNPRVLLIDEIDKSDIDLPNDLLHVFERGEFEIPELVRLADRLASEVVETADPPPRGSSRSRVPIEGGVVRCTSFPIVIMTSNGERDFPPAFFRRCLRVKLPDPTLEHLTAIIHAHFRQCNSEAKELINEFLKSLSQNRELANDQLMNAVHLLTVARIPDAEQRVSLRELLFKGLTSE